MPEKKLNLSGAKSLLSNEKPGLNLSGALGILKKKDDSQLASSNGTQTSKIGSLPFQSQVDTKTPSVLTEKGKVGYQEQIKDFKPAVQRPISKPKTLSEAVSNDDSYIGAIWNQIPGALSDFVGGLSKLTGKAAAQIYGKPVELLFDVVNKTSGQNIVNPIKDFTADKNIESVGKFGEEAVKKLRTSASSKEYEQGIQEGFDITNGIGFEDVKAVPVMLSRLVADAGLSIPTGGLSFVAQGYNQGLNEYDDAVKDIPKDLITDNAREGFAVIYGTINGLADKLGLDLITKSKPVSETVKKFILKEAVKALTKKEVKNITSDVIENTISNIAKSTFNKVKEVGVKTAIGAGGESVTESIQGGLSDGLKILTNKISDTNIFDVNEVKKNFWKSRINDAAGGFVLGGALGGLTNSLKSTDSYIAERIAESTTPEQIQLLKEELVNSVDDNGNPLLDEEKINILNAAIDKYSEANQKLPTGLGTEKRAKVLQLISERDQIKSSREAAIQNINNVDEAIKPEMEGDIAIFENKEQQKNDEIREAVSGNKYKYFQDEDGKFYKKLGKGKPEEISQEYFNLQDQENELETLKKEGVTITPETSSNYANMTEDDKGNFVFFHTGKKGYEKIKKSSGGTTATSKEEAAALSKVGGVAMYYTSPSDSETMVTGEAKYAVAVPKEKVYDFNTDKLNLIEEAKARHEAENPGKAFDLNSQLAYVTKVAGEKGFDMVVAQWSGKTRAQTTKEFSPSDIQETSGNVVTKKFDQEYESNKEKGFEPVIPVSKSEKLATLYDKINKIRNKEKRYDDLYRLYADSNKLEQDDITDLINESDLPQEIKNEYKEILESKEETRRSKKIAGEKVKVENAPEGNHLNIGLNEGRTENKMSIDDVLSKLPKDVKVINSSEIDVPGGEPTLVIETDRPLTAPEMAKLLGDTKQQAIPQFSNGEGVLYDTERGTDNGWGEFDPSLFILQDGKKLSEYAKGTEATPVKPIADLKQDVKKAKGKEAKSNALKVLKENSTPEDFKAFMDENPVYKKYEPKAEPVVEQEITDDTEIELPTDKKNVSKDRLAELEKQKKELFAKIRKAGSNLSSGFNPEVISDLVKLGAIYIEQGIITFKDFATQLKQDYGKDIPEDITRDIFRKSAASKGLGIRRTPERIGSGEAVSDELKDVANETNALYQKQDYKEIQDRLDSMSEADKNTLVGTLANVTGQLNAEGNVGVLAAIDLINMYEANGDKAGAKRVFDTISKSATAFAQLLRQYGQLKSSTPQGYVSIVEKHMADKYGVKLTDSQKQAIEKLYNNAKKAIDIHADALNDLADNLTDPNYDSNLGYKVWGQSTVLLEDANRKLADYIDSLKPATAQSLFQKLTSIVQGGLLSLKSLLLNPVANAAQAGIKLSSNEVANLSDFIINVVLKTGRTKISGFDPTAIRLGSKAFARGLSKANRMLMRGATTTDLAKIDVTGRLKPVEAWKSLYKSLRGKQSIEFVKTIEDLAEGTLGMSSNLALRLLPYGDLPRNEQVKIAKLIEIGRNKFGLKGKELEVFTLKPDPESLAEAELEGDKSTLQEPNMVYGFLNNLINSIDSKADDKFVRGLLSGIKFIVRGTIVPFLKTPINYAAKTIRFTNPIIPYSQAVYHMIKAIKAAKDINNPLLRESAIRKHQSKLTEYLGEAIIAQSVMSAAVILIGNGLITGEAPEEEKDKKEKDLMYSAFGPNMINISGLKRLLTGGDSTYKQGDTAIAYNALGILGAQLGISSNTLTSKEKEDIRKKKFVTTEGKPFYEENKGFYLTGIIDMMSNFPASLNYTLNQGFAQGTGTLLSSIQKNEYGKWSNQTVKTLVTGLAVPNTVYQSFKAGNDYYRNIYTEDQVKVWGNIVKERYGNIEDLPINYDMWGKPIKLTPEGSNPYIYHVLDIFRTQKILQDKNTYYIFDLHKKTGDKSVIPTSVTDIIDEEGGVYEKLTSAQKSELQRLVGEERAKYVDGKKGGAFSMKNYDPNNDSEVYWEKQVKKLKSAYKAGAAAGKRRFKKEVLDKIKK